MAGSFARFHLPRMRLWERSVALLRTKAAKLSDGKLSTPLLAEQRLDTPDKARSRRVSFRSAHSLIRGQDVGRGLQIRISSKVACSPCSRGGHDAGGHDDRSQDGRATDNLIDRKALFHKGFLFFIINLHRLHFTLNDMCCVRCPALRCRRDLPYLLLLSRRCADV